MSETDAAQPTPAALGVDVGGTRIKGGLVDADGVLLHRLQRPSPHREAPADQVEDAVVGVVHDLTGIARECTDHEVCRAAGSAPPLGVAVAGWVSARSGTVLFAPHFSWRDEPLGPRLTTRLDRGAHVDNDANAATWAEHRFGAGAGESDLVMVLLGTGIGGAIVREGRLTRGRHGLAGEFGHVRVVPDGLPCPCGSLGCWEQYASGTALLRTALDLIGSGGADTSGLLARCGDDPARLEGEDVTRAALDGDPASVGLLAGQGRWLGLGLAGIVASLDPGLVLVGGGLAEAGDLLLGPARATLAAEVPGRPYRPLPQVLPATLGPWAGVVGAADLARHDT